MEDCADMVAAFLMENNLMDNVEFSQRSEGFKIKLEIKKFPKDIAKSVRKSTRDMNTTFGGVKMRVKFMSIKLLDQSVITKMKDLLETLDSWTQELVNDRLENQKDYADLFYGYANNHPIIFDDLDPESSSFSESLLGSSTNFSFISFLKLEFSVI